MVYRFTAVSNQDCRRPLDETISVTVQITVNFFRFIKIYHFYKYVLDAFSNVFFIDKMELVDFIVYRIDNLLIKVYQQKV